MNKNEYPKLILPDWFDQRMQDEASTRGYLSHLQAELENGDRYLLYFIDPLTLKQVLEDETKLGHPYFAEPGMVVLPEVTVEKAKMILQYLLKDGFFKNLCPLGKNGYQNFTKAEN